MSELVAALFITNLTLVTHYMCPGISPKPPAIEKAGTPPCGPARAAALSRSLACCCHVYRPGRTRGRTAQDTESGGQARQSPFAASPPGARGLLGPLPPAAAPPRSRAPRQGAGGGTPWAWGAHAFPQRSRPGQWPSDASSQPPQCRGPQQPSPGSPSSRWTPDSHPPSCPLRAAHAQPCVCLHCSPVQGSGWAQGRCLLLAQPGEGPAEFHQRGDPSRGGR